MWNDGLLETAERLGPQWKKLAASLGLSSEEISSLEAKESGEQAVFMLKGWFSGQKSNKVQFGKLCDALASISRTDLISLLLLYAGKKHNLKSAIT